MKPSTKAALVSALILPGLGQLAILKRPKRGLAFLLPSIIALTHLMSGLAQSTTTLLDEALSGKLAPDPTGIATRLAETGDTPSATLAATILIICWLASLIDALAIKT